jgi:hypothetical protein
MRSTACLLVALLFLTSQNSAPPRLAPELDRVRAGLTASASAEEQAAPIARLDRAKAALEAGRPHLALYLMEMPWEAARSFAFVKASSAVATPEAFAKKWIEVGEPRPVAEAPGRRSPALIDALALAAEARGATTYHASRSFGEDTGVGGGLYYLGESQAVMQFAAMARTLEWPPAGSPPAFRSLTTELAALDTEMTTAYETMERANHSTYIVASAALKQARTLNDSGQYGAALFEYLLSRYLFAAVRGPAAAEATSERIAETRRSLPAGVDHSVAELFLQLAEEGVAGAVPAQRRGAAATIEDVIPAYLRAIAPASTTTAVTPDALVTLTLVRWPFT